MKRNYYQKLLNGRNAVLSLVAAMALGGTTLMGQAVLKLHYTFDPADVSGTTVPDKSGSGYNATLVDGAAVINDGTTNVLDFGTSNGYLDMGATTGVLINSLSADYSISLMVFIDAAADINTNGQWLWGFANSTILATEANGGMFFEPKRTRAAISKTHYGGEQAIQLGEGQFPKGSWTHVVYTQKGTEASLYFNGVLKQTGSVTLHPSDLGATPYNFIGRPCYDGDLYLKNTKMSDFRIYSGALTTTEIMTLAGSTLPEGFPMDLYPAMEAFTLDNLSQVSTDLTLPTTAGDGSIAVTWASSNTGIISTTGVVTRPSSLDTDVVLTATFTKNGVSVSKKFTAKVMAISSFGTPLMVQYTFLTNNISGATVKDEMEKGFVATLKNGAVVREIGDETTGKFNVLDLGTTDGYLDFGTGVGELIYGLSDFTMSAYFRINENYTNLGTWGNNLWCFNNSDDPVVNKDGNLYCGLKQLEYQISNVSWQSGQQGVALGQQATLGTWHHIAYSQLGEVGTLYLDGEVIATGTVTHKPSVALAREGKTGTTSNYIGHPTYAGDCYLQQTLVYDFRMYNIGMSKDDVAAELLGSYGDLQAAYAAKVGDVVGYPTDLQPAADALTLNDISAVESNLTLPTSVGDGIAISWATSCNLIDPSGAVTRPEKLNTDVVLTATLSKNGYTVTKQFTATVKAVTPFTTPLMVQYTFPDAKVSGTTVTDESEMAYAATLKGGAAIRKIGTDVSGKFNVLDMRTGTAYLDLGAEIGKLAYGMKDYTMSAYFRINEAYTKMGRNGNFLWSFSNSSNVATDQNGIMFVGLNKVDYHVSAKYYNSGNQSVAFGQAPTLGTWNHLAYTQIGGVGTIYLNGAAVATGPITNLLGASLQKPGLSGALCNYIGRSGYNGDLYLDSTMVYDFRIYSEGKDETGIAALASSVEALNTAYSADPIGEIVAASTKVPSLKTSYVSITTSRNLIQINNLKGTEKVSVVNLAGQAISFTNANAIAVNNGIYLVSVNGEVYKVMVK